MTISYYATQAAADAQGGSVAFCLGVDGKPLALPWCALTGPDAPLVQSKTSISIQEFRDRLTQAETDAILTAARTDVNIDRAIWLLSSQVDGLLHFDDPRAGQTLSYLVSRGLLAPDRPAQLLA